ncbi:MAG: ATP-binding protein [Planctomycetota bacterium]
MKLIITRGPNKGQVFDVQEEVCSIGRAHSNGVVLYDRRVSARHAAIESAEDGPVIRDLGSSNGTYVNGVLVTRMELEPGDTIQLGDTELAFQRVPESVQESASFRVVEDASQESSAIHARMPSRESSQIVDVDRAAPNVEALQEDRRKLVALYRVNSVINSVRDTRELLCRVLEEIFDVLRAERGFVMLADPETGDLMPAAMRRRYATDDAEQVAISRTIARQVLEDGEAVLSTDAVADERFSAAESVISQGIRSAMCAPLHGREAIQGIIYLDNAGVSRFRPRDLQLLVAMANELGVAIENQRLAEARLDDERFAAIGQAVAGLSHYIKNILGCMQGGSQMVERAMANDNESMLRTGWGIVRRNESKIAELVLDMLNYSGASEPVLEPCHVNDLVAEVAEAAGAHADKSFAVHCDLADDLPIVPLDVTALHRCLLNLLSNAIDALPDEGGVVRFVTRHDAEHAAVCIAVADNGCGIDPELLPTIFDVFVSTKGAKGTGLGLAVVRKLVEEHGGRVEIDSQPDQGTTLTLVLPVPDEAEQPTKTDIQAPAAP